MCCVVQFIYTIGILYQVIPIDLPSFRPRVCMIMYDESEQLLLCHFSKTQKNFWTINIGYNYCRLCKKGPKFFLQLSDKLFSLITRG